MRDETDATIRAILRRIADLINKEDSALAAIYSPEHLDVDIDLTNGHVYRVKVSRVN